MFQLLQKMLAAQRLRSSKRAFARGYDFAAGKLLMVAVQDRQQLLRAHDELYRLSEIKPVTAFDFGIRYAVRDWKRQITLQDQSS